MQKIRNGGVTPPGKLRIVVVTLKRGSESSRQAVAGQHSLKNGQQRGSSE